MNDRTELKVNQLGLLSLKSALYIMKKRFGFLFLLSFVGFGLPYFVFEWISASYGFAGVIAIKRLIGDRSMPVAIETLLGPVAAFLSFYFPAGFMLVVIWLTTYFVLIIASGHFLNGTSLPAPHTLIFRGFLICLRRGLASLMLITLVALLLRGFLIVVFVLVCLALMSPVLLVENNKGVFSSLRSSFLLSYAGRFNKWNVLFQVVSYGSFLLALLVLSNTLMGIIPVLDKYLALDRSFFLATASDIPLYYYVTTVCGAMLNSLIICLFAVFSTAYYLSVSRSQVG